MHLPIPATGSSPPKRNFRLPSATPSLPANSSSASRPQSPVSMRRPTSSMSMRSPTPTLFAKRPGTPSLHFSNSGAMHSTPALQTTSSLPAPSMSSTSLLSQQQQQQQQQLQNSYTGYIKVSVRVKPPNIHKSGSATKVETSPDGTISTINDQWVIDTARNSISSKEVGEFVFDHVYQGSIPNSQIFDNSVSDLVDQVMAGYNGTVFAYGMTGSGKTYAMQGDASNPGIIPLSAKAIFDYVNSSQNNSNDEEQRVFTIKIAYLEIYNEHLNDLLSPSTPSEDIKIRDDPIRGVRALGLKEVVVTSPEQLLEHIQSGDALRRTEGTEFNSKSSRSHAVVQVSIESSTPSQQGVRTSSLYLCDLAGSERAASQSERRKEGAYINKSLLTLGTVIARLCAVSTGQGASAGHIPYRDSKLTRLLQPALSGKSLVNVLCTIDVNTGAGVGGVSGTGTGNITASNSTNTTYIETVSTLRFAARAKNIMVSVKRNEDTGDNSRLIEKLMYQLEAQKIEIVKLKAANNAVAQIKSRAGANGSGLELSADNSAQYISQIAQLEAENKILHERVEHLTRLCDDTKLEEMIFGDENIDDNNFDFDTPLSATSATFSNLEENHPVRKQINEYKSYISHLEKQLYLAEVHKTSSGGSNTLFADQNENDPLSFNSNGVNGGGSSISLPHASSYSASRYNSNNDQTSYYNEVIQDLKEEVEELQESNADKDRIIAALRSINRRKDNLNALSMNRAYDYGSHSSLSSTGNSSTNLNLSPSASRVNAMAPAAFARSRANNTNSSQLYQFPTQPQINGQAISNNIPLQTQIQNNPQQFTQLRPVTPTSSSRSAASDPNATIAGAGASSPSKINNNTMRSFEVRPVSSGSSPVRNFSLQETTASAERHKLNDGSGGFGIGISSISSPPQPPPPFLPSTAPYTTINKPSQQLESNIDLFPATEDDDNGNDGNDYPDLENMNINSALEDFEKSFVNREDDFDLGLTNKNSVDSRFGPLIGGATATFAKSKNNNGNDDENIDADGNSSTHSSISLSLKPEDENSDVFAKTNGSADGPSKPKEAVNTTAGIISTSETGEQKEKKSSTNGVCEAQLTNISIN